MQYLLNKILIIGLVFGSTLSSPIKLASAESIPTCQNKEIRDTKITALCAAISNEKRRLEYLHCWPSMTSQNQVVTHYVFQKTYTDKENYDGEAFGSLFSGTGKTAATTRELKDIAVIDAQLEAQSTLDVAFVAKNANLNFVLMIKSTDGDALEGSVTDTKTSAKTDLSCLDISLEK